ncbi:MAG: energy-coupling factor transporter transmembrane component T [Velocimicrobium sp.]
MRNLFFDPRTKLILMIFTVITATQAPTLEYECLLIALITFFGFLCKKGKNVIWGSAVFAALYLFTVFYLRSHIGSVYTMMTAWLSLIFQMYPCGLLAGIVIKTTKINEFMSAMSRARISKRIVIPFAIMMRYVPVVKEDWNLIKDAMRMRGIEPSFAGMICHPGLTVECIYVPMLMTASKAADELTIASVTRGIENPKHRTCLVELAFGLCDYIALLLFGTLVVGCFFA